MTRPAMPSGGEPQAVPVDGLDTLRWVDVSSPPLGIALRRDALANFEFDHEVSP
jgi:hypothetical protein